MEQAIGRLKNFHQLDGPLRIGDLTRLHIEIKVVSHLSRFQPLLVRDLDFRSPLLPDLELPEIETVVSDGTYEWTELLFCEE